MPSSPTPPWRERMKSPVHDVLVGLGARYDSSSGHDLPTDFGDALEEHGFARRTAAIADRSLLSKIELRGSDRAKFLHNLCTNDIKGLAPGRGCEAYFANIQGKILAYVRVW